MRDRDQQAATIITQKVCAHVPLWYGPEAVVVSRQPVIRRLTNSFFLRYTVRTQNERHPGVLIKVPRPARVDTLQDALEAQKPRPSIHREYDFLHICMRIFDNGFLNDFCAVRAFDLFAEWNAIAMEELNCHSLRVIDANGMNLSERISKAARWLKIFHSKMGECKQTHLNVAVLRSQFENMFSKLEENTPMTIPQIGSIKKLLKHRLDRVGKTSIPFAPLHGDFKCGNILVTQDGRLGAVDSKLRGPGPIYSDFGRLISSVLSQRWNVLTFGKMQDYYDCKEAVRSGYFKDEPFHHTALDLYSAFSILEKWEEHERSLQQYGYIPFMRRTRREYFCQMLHQCLQ